MANCGLFPKLKRNESQRSHCKQPAKAPYNTHWYDVEKLCSFSQYRKDSSRGAYGHNPFWSVFEEHHNNRYYNGTIYIIDNIIVLSDLVESSGYSSKTLQKESCPYAPLDKVLRYIFIYWFCLIIFLPVNALNVLSKFLFKFHITVNSSFQLPSDVLFSLFKNFFSS